MTTAAHPGTHDHSWTWPLSLTVAVLRPKTHTAVMAPIADIGPFTRVTDASHA